MLRHEAVVIGSVGQTDRTHFLHYGSCSFQASQEIAIHCRQFLPMYVSCIDWKRVEPSIDSGFGESERKPSRATEVQHGLDHLNRRQVVRPVRTTGNSGLLGIPGSVSRSPTEIQRTWMKLHGRE